MTNTSTSIPKRHGAGSNILAAITGSAIFLAQCAPKHDGVKEDQEPLQTQLETARAERDSLLEKLDAATRERVDLDGELNRLRQELEKLKDNLSEGKSEPAAP